MGKLNIPIFLIGVAVVGYFWIYKPLKEHKALSTNTIRYPIQQQPQQYY